MDTPKSTAALFTVAKRWQKPVYLETMGKHMGSPHRGTVFSLRKVGNSDACCNLDEP
jgi:hypothetical protein